MALPAGLCAIQGTSEPLEGIPAECDGVLLAKQTAGASFNMNIPKDADPIETTDAF